MSRHVSSPDFSAKSPTRYSASQRAALPCPSTSRCWREARAKAQRKRIFIGRRENSRPGNPSCLILNSLLHTKTHHRSCLFAAATLRQKSSKTKARKSKFPSSASLLDLRASAVNLHSAAPAPQQLITRTSLSCCAQPPPYFHPAQADLDTKISYESNATRPGHFKGQGSARGRRPACRGRGGACRRATQCQPEDRDMVGEAAGHEASADDG